MCIREAVEKSQHTLFSWYVFQDVCHGNLQVTAELIYRIEIYPFSCLLIQTSQRPAIDAGVPCNVADFQFSLA